MIPSACFPWMAVVVQIDSVELVLEPRPDFYFDLLTLYGIDYMVMKKAIVIGATSEYDSIFLLTMEK